MRIRTLLATFTLASLVLATLAPSAALADPDPEDQLAARIPTRSGDSQGDLAGSPQTGVASNMATIGTNALGDRGFNADVWVYKHAGGRYAAYVGQWGFGDATHPERCPSGDKSGVKVIDVTDPSTPTLIASLQNPPRTTAEDVEVITYRDGRAIAMVGIQACFRTDPSIKRGLQIFDVTDPTAPRELGFLDTGMAARGVHEFTAKAVGRRVIAALTVPFSQLRDARGRGDVRIADVTDPSRPVEIADFHFVRDAGLPGTLAGFGCFPFNFAHGATIDAAGTRAFVSSFDLGTVILDIANPARPKFLGRTPFAANVEGDAHSNSLSADERYLYQADEVIPPNSNCQAPDRQTESSWGYVRIYDVSDPANPVEVGAFRTPNSASPNRMRKGDYSAHNPLVVGGKLYASWYSDGVRVASLADPRNPSETAFLVPAPAKDPLHVLGFVPEVWGVVVDDRGCVYLSDMNSGLHVVKETSSTSCR